MSPTLVSRARAVETKPMAVTVMAGSWPAGGRQGVAAPLAHPVDLDADAGPLAGGVGVPAATGAEVDRRGVGGLADDLGDDAAQLARRGERVDQAEDVLGRERRRQERTRRGGEL